MKAFVLAPGEGWIVDRFVDEWKQFNGDITVDSPYQADVIWLLADWCFDKVPYELLRRKKVITSVHHIVPEKFDGRARASFVERDRITDAYHVYNDRTYSFISGLTEKPIKLIKYWANPFIWKRTMSTDDAKVALGLAADRYVIGSFQRDTEGHDLRLPKLEKGPDLLADALVKMSASRDNITVLLGGWRRQYLISRLKDAGIDYVYIGDNDPKSQPRINTMYQALDLYAVTARYEGGPQSLLECGLVGVPTVTRPVGIAEQVLPSESINDDISIAVPTIPTIDKETLMPTGFIPYVKMMKEVLDGRH